MGKIYLVHALFVFETQKRKVKSTCFKNCLCFKTQKRKVKSMCFKNSDFNKNQNPRLKSIYFLHFKKCRNLSNSSLNVHFFFWNFMLLIERKTTKMANQEFNFCSIFTSCILWNAGTKNCITQECRKQGWSWRRKDSRKVHWPERGIVVVSSTVKCSTLEL